MDSNDEYTTITLSDEDVIADLASHGPADELGNAGEADTCYLACLLLRKYPAYSEAWVTHYAAQLVVSSDPRIRLELTGVQRGLVRAFDRVKVSGPVNTGEFAAYLKKASPALYEVLFPGGTP